MTETTTHTFAVGDRVVIENRGDGWDGVTGTIQSLSDKGDELGWIVEYDDPSNNPFATSAPYFVTSGRWTEEAGFLQPLTVDGEKPLLAALKAETSRTYAAKAKSRLLKPHENLILTKASAGHEIDVVAFRKAATAALSLASTRAGQSMARRDWAREARHLIYWADAIIDNHLKGLPVYEGGPRSPRIAELEREVEHAGVVNQSLTSDLTTLKQAASDERRRLCAEIDAGKAAYAKVVEAANGEIDKFQERHNQDYKELQGLYLEINEAHAALEYAFGLLNDEQQSRLAGFRDGYAARVNEQ